MCKKLIYFASFIFVFSLAFASGAKAADPNCVGWWPLNEGAGDAVIDLSGNGINGTINNPNGGLGLDSSVWIEDAKRGMVLSFNGVNGTGACVATRVTIPAMDLTTDFTWMFWCKQDASQGFTSATGGNDVILGNRYGGTTSPLQFVKFTPTNFEYYNGNNTSFINYPDIPSGVWVHNVTVKKGATLTYYRDGFEVLSITLTNPQTMGANPLYMGADGYSGVQEAWCGCLSDVRLYNKALTQLEILAAVAGVEVINMEVGYAGKAPAIDGEADYVWESASTQSFVPLEDPADASGTWKVLYDAENLYVLLDVTDDSLQNDSASSWQDDSVEVYFDGGNTKLSTALSGDDHQYTFGWTADDIQGTNITGATEGIEQAQVTTATGWRIEIKMPWLSIQGVAPQARDLIGIDCYYNDDDDGGDSREGKMLSFSAVEGWNDASQWGTAILAVPPEPVDPGADGLVASYAFENDVNDSSGNGFHGVIIGAPSYVDGLGGHGMAMEFDGESYVDCGNDPKLDITGPLSISIWMRPGTDGSVETAPLSKADATAGWSWQLRYGWNAAKPTIMGFQFNVTDGSRAWVYVNQALAVGEWYHIVGAYDGTTVKCYLDGVETDSAPMAGIVGGTSSLLIGSDGWRDDWIGAIDEVAIYNQALSTGEIRYLAGFRQNDPEANKVVARRFFEEMWNQAKLDIVDELITADMAGHAPTGEFTGYEGEKQTVQGNLAAFPDLQITVDDIFAEGDRVALRTSYSGTHTGTLMGKIPPTGLPIKMTGCIIFRFENGKVAEAWSFADILGLMQQIGAASPARTSADDYAWSAPSDATGEPGDLEANKAMVHRFVDEVWNQQKLDVMDEIFSSGVVSHNPPIEYLYGRSNLEILRQGVVDYLAAYPDLQVVVNDVVAEGDMASARWTLKGTHLGPLMGIPATGKAVTFTGVTMYRFAGGKIVEMWWAWDTMGMMRQITQP